MTISLLGVYAAAFCYLNGWAPEISDGAKRFLAQFGVMVIFLSGLLANIGIFWAAKVKHNRDFAESEIQQALEYLEVLRDKQVQLNKNFSSQINRNEKRLEVARLRLMEVNEHPKIIDFSGHVSVFVLAAGTLMCVVGAG